ncbi:MAG: amino acid ABC transporter permease [Lachnospiraceae bacterium]|nr:amino acid ABC transporter permease [Lachnospiraceae bacterium]
MGLLTVIKQIASGFGATLIIFFFTLLFSMPLGILVALGRMSKFKPLSILIQGIISVLRGTPLMLQLIVVFYGPYYLFGLKLSTSWRLYATLIGFSINYAAYFAEIFRAGIQSIPVGQTEAATVLGYTKAQTFLKIIFPQMIKRTIPPVTNEVITLVKDTSLAFVLAYQEMFTYAKQVSASMSSLMPLFVAGVFYYLFNLVVTLFMNYIEKRLSYYN